MKINWKSNQKAENVLQHDLTLANGYVGYPKQVLCQYIKYIHVWDWISLDPIMKIDAYRNEIRRNKYWGICLHRRVFYNHSQDEVCRVICHWIFVRLVAVLAGNSFSDYVKLCHLILNFIVMYAHWLNSYKWITGYVLSWRMTLFQWFEQP